MTDDLAALVGSRICHDLISPLGAIANGVELLALSGSDLPPEMALIADSVTNANARLRFFRLAYGAASAEQMVPVAEARGIAGDLWREGRLRVRWEAEAPLPRPEVRLAFLVLQCLEAAMIRGGEIVVSRAGRTWTLSGAAPRLRVEPALWARLDGGAGDGDGALGSAQVQFALAPLAAAAAGRRLVWTEAAERLTVMF